MLLFHCDLFISTISSQRHQHLAFNTYQMLVYSIQSKCYSLPTSKGKIAKPKQASVSEAALSWGVCGVSLNCHIYIQKCIQRLCNTWGWEKITLNLFMAFQNHPWVDATLLTSPTKTKHKIGFTAGLLCMIDWLIQMIKPVTQLALSALQTLSSPSLTREPLLFPLDSRLSSPWFTFLHSLGTL